MELEQMKKLNQLGPMIHPEFKPNYMEPLDRFKEWVWNY